MLSSAARPNDVFVQRITMSGIEGNPAEVWNEHQFLDDSIRGGVKTTKLDGYYQSATAQGDGTMQGATFAIKNASENPVVVGGVTYEPGKDVATITSGADGVAQTASDLLPTAPTSCAKPSRRRATCSPTKYGASRSARTARLWRRPPSRPSTTR